MRNILFLLFSFSLSTGILSQSENNLDSLMSVRDSLINDNAAKNKILELEPLIDKLIADEGFEFIVPDNKREITTNAGYGDVKAKLKEGDTVRIFAKRNIFYRPNYKNNDKIIEGYAFFLVLISLVAYQEIKLSKKR